MCQYWLTSCNKSLIPGRMLIIKLWKGYVGTLILSTQFFCNPKVILKNKYIIFLKMKKPLNYM